VTTDCVLPVRPPKNMVRGRCLATFSSNCFAINENQEPELVAAGVLVATSGHPLHPKRDTLIYDLHDEIVSGQTRRTPSRDMTARVETRQALVPKAQPQSRSFASAQDFACGLPLSRGAGSLTPAKRAQVVKERITSRLPYSPATAGSRLPKGPRLAKRVARR